MKKYIVLILVLYSSVSFGGANGTGRSIISNTIEETTPSSTSLSLETSLYGAYAFVTPKISHTNKDKLELSFSMSNFAMGDFHSNYSPYIGFNKFITFNSYSAVLFGSSTGYNFARNNGVRNYSYVDFRFRPIKSVHNHFVLHIGPYFASNPLSTAGDLFGYQYGFEGRYRKYTLSMDWVSGTNNISGGDLKLSYSVGSGYSIWTGLSIPAPDSGNYFNGVLGVSYKY